MRRKTRFLALLLFIATPALAQESPPMGSNATGMHHMSVTTIGQPAAAPKAKPETPVKTAAEDKPTPAPKALPPKDALKKLDTLSPWPYYTDLMTISNDTALEKIIHTVDIDPGSVPPKGLFYLAKALAERKRFNEAAFYYYAGQLRATFDMARFPPYEINDKKNTVPDKRTEDQKGDVPDAAPMLVNPHAELSMLALSIGSPVARWAMADNARLETVMLKVRDWDLATPYAYLPDYDTTHAVAFETWPDLLTKTRNDYFLRVRQIAQGLNAIRPVAPTPSFSRP